MYTTSTRLVSESSLHYSTHLWDTWRRTGVCLTYHRHHCLSNKVQHVVFMFPSLNNMLLYKML